MDDKTPLELDIEHLERFRTPPGIKALIVVLIIIIIFLGFHSIMLKELLQTKVARIEEIKEDFDVERSGLNDKVRELEEQVRASK